MLTPEPEAACCPEANELVSHRNADDYFGPAKAGWCVVRSADYDGELFYQNVHYCPFCGSKLPC